MKGVDKLECCLCLENISAFIDGELNAAEQQQIATHLLTCSNCQAVVYELRSLTPGLRQTVETIPVPGGMAGSILFAIGLERQRAKKQLSLTGLLLFLIVSPLLLFSSVLWRFVHMVYFFGAIIGRAEPVILQLISPATGWVFGIIGCSLMVGGVLFVRAMLRGFDFNEVFS